MIGKGGVGNPWIKEDHRLIPGPGLDPGLGGVQEELEGWLKGRKEKGEGDNMDVNGYEGREMRSKDAMKVLEKHVTDRLPYMQLASRRLQAIMGLRNELVFG